MQQKLGQAMIVKILEKQQNAAYVLITCAAEKDGRMEVELTRGGDADLAAYLIESAHNLIEVDA